MLFARPCQINSPTTPPTSASSSSLLAASATSNSTSATVKMAHHKVTCHGAGLVSGDADFKNSFTVFVEQGKIGGISVAFEGKYQQPPGTC